LNTDNLSAISVGIGVIALIIGFGIYFNNISPNNTVASQQHTNFIPTKISVNNVTGLANIRIDKSQFKPAPEFTKISGYINTNPIKLSDLKGKVVLVDFWTYSCINCIRTIPYLNAWYEKYEDKGLVIVGVHTPEFEFEKDYSNVKAAVQKFGIKYPVIQDNDKGTWQAYDNRYWPHKYLIDNEGYIRYDHIGEGSYSDTEKVIQSLLAERAASLGANITIDKTISKPSGTQSIDFTKINTPELYFGYKYARIAIGNQEGFKPDQVVKYTLPSNDKITPNRIYLEGEWKNNPDNMELQSEVGHIVLTYSAKVSNIVAGGHGNLQILEDKQNIIDNSRGTDVSNLDQVIINGQRLYNLTMHKDYGEHDLVIDVKGKGFQIYTFTFG
jgi:thiol-disulfide isomerase/thioredoxin